MSNIAKPLNAALAIVALCLTVSFGFWMNYMERCGKRPLIPNSLWRNMAFSTVCLIVMIDWAQLNSMEYFYVLM